MKIDDAVRRIKQIKESLSAASYAMQAINNDTSADSFVKVFRPKSSHTDSMLIRKRWIVHAIGESNAELNAELEALQSVVDMAEAALKGMGMNTGGNG